MPNRIGLLVATIVCIALACVVPAVRLRCSTGSWGITVFDRGATLRQRCISFGFGVCASALLTWVGFYVARGNSGLRMWAAPYCVSGIGWVALLSGLTAMVAAQAQMGASWRIGIDHSPTLLITNGLFAFIRNPIYSAGGISLFGMVLVAPSPCLLTITATLALLTQLQVRLEEQHLIRTHGNHYLEYASKVGRFIPGIGHLERRTNRA